MDPPRVRAAYARRAAFGALLAGLAACQAGGKGSSAERGGESASATPGTSATSATSTSGAGGSASDSGGAWVVLFDGTDLGHWRGYKRQDVPTAWRVEEKTLTFVPSDDKNARGDLITRDQYGDFEFDYEWKISPGGNSGVIYRADEDHDHVYESGAEMQVLDNTRHPDGRTPVTSAGADYALYAPVADVTRPVGEWNAARIVARGPHVEHWLNGRKIVEYEQGSPDWKRRVAASKFAAMPAYGTHLKGYIALQDHGARVWFRNIRVRPLGGAQ